MSWFVYIVQAKDTSLYTGITTDIQRRVNEHNTGKGARSLRGKLPVTLRYMEVAKTNKDAASREREIKGWTRSKKLSLVQNSKGKF